MNDNEPIEAGHDNHPPPEEQKPPIRSFYKILTTSDTKRHYAFYVLKKHAEKCFPPLDYSQPTPSQELMAKDLHGYTWSFTHVYRGICLPFLRIEGSRGGMLSPMGGRNLFVKRDCRWRCFDFCETSCATDSCDLSSESQIGVLSSASQALCKNKEFVVYYNSRAFPFIVGINQYLKAVAHNFSTGMHVIMNSNGGENRKKERRGVIVDQTTISKEWPGSEWRSLKVQWNVPSRRSLIHMPERVSPWQLEPIPEDVRSRVGEASLSRNTRLQIFDHGPTHYANTNCDESLHAFPSSSASLADKEKEHEKPRVLRLFGLDIHVTTPCTTSETN
ncbi:hypothetical protein OSB04_031848 [Centaurea solstitialis]|uniref:Auxin response factor domain-containing protein n=1 Tax=Centaurea solstitialis TaxID=347529 RepID=A0AA38SAC2_9ASTR|nr:hypothetical protein OSB04_031848 [Centaurea solstitialis]